MAIGIFLGIAAGLFLGERCAVLAPYSAAYIKILKITAIPYLIVAIIQGVAILNRAQGLQILKKGSIFIALAMCINISIIYLIKWSIPTPEGTYHSGYVGKEVTPLDFSSILIPENVFYALANNIVPAIVVFSLLIGISLMYLGDKQATMAGLQTLRDALTKVTAWISRTTPLGTFIIMANQVGTIQFSTIKQMSTYIILYILGTALVVFWIFPRLLSILTPIRANQWLKNMAPILILTYTTSLVIIALPYIINMIQKELQTLYPKDDNAQTQVQGTVSLIFNLPFGSIFVAAFVLFIAVFYSVPLNFAEHVKIFSTTFLTSLGGIGLGSWVNSLTFILDAIGLPLDAITLYLAIVPFTAGFQSMVSAMIVATLACLITLAGRGLLQIRWKRLVFGGLFTVLPVLCIFGALNIYYPLPRIKHDEKTIYDLEIAADLKVNMYYASKLAPLPASTPAPAPASASTPAPGESALQRILTTKTLRVGYHPDSAPFCFFNKTDKLVGFDVAYAYQLAYDLGCEQIDFIPFTAKTLAAQLNDHQFDIAISAIPISEVHLTEMCFPDPILEAKIVFVCKDNLRDKFAKIEAIQADKSLSIAAVVHTSYEGIAYAKFPHRTIVILDHVNEFAQTPPPADALIWEEQEAIAWTIEHPFFHVVFPKPSLGKQMLGYPIQQGDAEFACFLQSWIKLKEAEGFKKQQYELWILGHTKRVAPPQPRWSFLDNVLGWGKDKRESRINEQL